MSKPWSLAIFIGRFQPFHLGHIAVINEAFAQADNVLILCGSNNVPRTLKNPFTYAERKSMIRSAFSDTENKRLYLAAIDDYPYDDPFWIKHVREVVASELNNLPVDQKKIALIGHKKDESSYYLDLFPDWHWLSVENFQGISATPIRKAFLRDALMLNNQSLLPDTIRSYLTEFSETDQYQYLHEARLEIDQEKAAWASAPYPVVLVTVDALIEYRGKLLTVVRKNHPGKNLFALPGGFLEVNESLFKSCIREVQEETNLVLPDKIWRQAFQSKQLFDAVDRSERGRVISQVFHFKLDDRLELSDKVQGGDDAGKAFWLDKTGYQAKLFFDDHYHIIREFLGSW